MISVKKIDNKIQTEKPQYRRKAVVDITIRAKRRSNLLLGERMIATTKKQRLVYVTEK